MKKFNFKGVTAQTWARTIVIVLALISQLAVILGKRSEAIDIDRWQEYVTYIFTVGASIVACGRTTVLRKMHRLPMMSRTAPN